MAALQVRSMRPASNLLCTFFETIEKGKLRGEHPKGDCDWKILFNNHKIRVFIELIKRKLKT